MTLTSRLKVLDEVEQRARRNAGVLARDRLARVVADAAAATHEEHRDVGDGAHRLAVVAGARRPAGYGHTLALDGALELPHEPRGARGDAELLNQLKLAGEPAALGDGVDLGLCVHYRPRAQLVARRADVDRELGLARDDVDRARPCLDAADGADELGTGARYALDREHAFRGGSERVVAQVHRHGAGMPGGATQASAQAREAVDRSDHADRQSLGFQHRSLLDVHLYIGEQAALRATELQAALRIETELAERLAHRSSGRVARLERPGIEPAGECAAAEHRRAEAHAFLVAKADHLERKRQPAPGTREGTDAFDRRDHAEHAVVAAGVAHGVEVRAEDEARCAARAAVIAADGIADRIERRAHAGFAHPAEYEVGGRAVLRRQEDARQAARQLALPGELVAALHDAVGIEHAAIVNCPACSSSSAIRTTRPGRCVRGSR